MKKSEKICSIDGCDRVHYAKGFCKMHYQRLRKHGDPSFTKGAANGDPMRFIEEAVKNAGEECIIWPYGTNGQGYGQIQIVSKTNGTARMVHAHRLALSKFSGEKDPGNELEAAHGDCHDRLCINPKHLSFKTRSENQKDRLRDGTDQRGEKNHKAKLTEEQVREIFNDPRMNYVIAGEYGVHRETISRIKTGRTWKHLELTTQTQKQTQ